MCLPVPRVCHNFIRIDARHFLLARPTFRKELIFPAPFTPAISIYFFVKTDSFQLPFSGFFLKQEITNHFTELSLFSVSLLIQAVKYPLVLIFLSLDIIFHIFYIAHNNTLIKLCFFYYSNNSSISTTLFHINKEPLLLSFDVSDCYL